MASSTVYSLVGKNLKLTSREDIKQYIEEINNVEDLQEIHLGGNTLGVGACQALGEVLKTKKQLKVANFDDIFTGRLITEIPDALRALCDSLVDNTSLVEINLSDNAFGGRSAEPMVNFLTHNHHFSILKLSNNEMGIQGGKIIATALIEAAEELKKLELPSKLKTIICGRNRLEDGSASTWSKAYSLHTNLEEVRMFQNGIRMDGIIAITQGLSNCPNLKVLDLQDNTATLRGSRGIAASLPKWPQLEVLNLSDCLLKPKGGYLVIDALGKGANSNLKTLQLQYCDLDRKALDLLGKVIGSGAVKELVKLDINGNWADEEDECIEKIKEGLGKYGHEDALDELDEMDPDGEDEGEEADEDEEVDEEDESKEAEEESGEADEDKKLQSTSEVATAAVAGSGVAGVAATLTDSKGDSTSQHLEATASSEKEEEIEKAREANPPIESKEESEKTSQGKEDSSTSEIAAAVIAVPAATATVAGAGLAAAVANSKDGVENKMEELDISSAEPKEEQKQEFASTKDVQEVFPEENIPATSTSAKEDEAIAQSAAEVAETAQQVPEASTAAENAAEVSESAEEVHAADAKEQEQDLHHAQVADEVSKEAEKAGVSDKVEAQDAMVEDEGNRKETASTADQVAESAQKLHASDEKKQEEDEDKLTEMMAKTQIAPIPDSPKSIKSPLSPTSPTSPKRHTKSDSVDLSGELYADEAVLRSTATAAGGSNNPSQGDQVDAAQTSSPPPPPPKKKSGFRAAMGAVRELLR